MEQAQPGELLNSHGPISGGGQSQAMSMSHLQGSNQYLQREASPPPHLTQEASLANITKAGASAYTGDPSSRTDPALEGGSVEHQSSTQFKQKYMASVKDLQGSHNYNGSISGQI